MGYSFIENMQVWVTSFNARQSDLKLNIWLHQDYINTQTLETSVNINTKMEYDYWQKKYTDFPTQITNMRKKKSKKEKKKSQAYEFWLMACLESTWSEVQAHIEVEIAITCTLQSNDQNLH